MIPSAYKKFIDEIIYLTDNNKMKWTKTIEDEMFIYKSNEVTLTVIYYTDMDAETSYYSFIYSVPRKNIKDGFRISHYDSDYDIMEKLYSAASRSAQDIQDKLSSLLDNIKTETIFSKIKEGEARTAILQNEEKINVGFIRIEDDYVVYYTGKGLREIFKPNMNEGEKKNAEKLKKWTEKKLIKEKYIERRKISEFIDII